MMAIFDSKWLYIGIAGALGLALLRYRNRDDRVQSTIDAYKQLAAAAEAKAAATSEAARATAQAAYDAAVARANAEHALFDKIENYIYG